MNLVHAHAYHGQMEVTIACNKIPLNILHYHVIDPLGLPTPTLGIAPRPKLTSGCLLRGKEVVLHMRVPIICAY